MIAPRAVLLDLDGTLVDTMPTLTAIALDVLERHHRLARTDGRPLYLRTSGVPFARQLEAIFPGDPRNRAAAEEYEASKRHATGHLKLEMAVRTALDALRRRGIRLVVSSNGYQPDVDRFVAASDDLFALGLGYTGGASKGEPHFSVVCERFGLDRSALVFVGDSLHDADLALAARVRFVACLGTFPPEAFRERSPDVAMVQSVCELPRLFLGDG
jgi:phosphoglycolate phosphatase